MLQLPILQVLLPLLAAPVCLAFNKEALAWLMAIAAAIGATITSVMLLVMVMQGGPISYHMGGWPALIGIEYRIDVLSAWLLVIVSTLGAVMLVPARACAIREIEPSQRVYFFVTYLLCLAALLGIISSGDLFNIFVFLEISALSSYILIAMGKDRMALVASIRYLVLGTIGATFILIGIGLLYSKTGTLNIKDLSLQLREVEGSRTVLTAFCFLAIGTMLKLALFPLHVWLPNAYTYAPSIVSAFLAATATKTALYLLIRLCYSVFGETLQDGVLPLEEVLLALGILGIFAGSLMAAAQTNLKRMFAYSSVAQIGFMVLGLGLASAAGLTATLIHIFNHALMKGALFLALAGLVYRIGDVRLSDMAGLGRAMPLTFAAIVIGGLSLIGVPLTAGFISKWYLVQATLEQDMWWLTVVILLGSLLTGLYIFRVIEAAWFRDSGTKQVSEAPLIILLPTWLLVGANIYFGLDASLSISVSEAAAMYLMGTSP